MNNGDKINAEDQYGFERLLADDSGNQDIERVESVMERLDAKEALQSQEESKEGSDYVSSNILMTKNISKDSENDIDVIRQPQGSIEMQMDGVELSDFSE